MGKVIGTCSLLAVFTLSVQLLAQDQPVAAAAAQPAPKTVAAKPDSIPATLGSIAVQLPTPVMIPAKRPQVVDSMIAIILGVVDDFLAPDSLALKQGEISVKLSYTNKKATIDRAKLKTGAQLGKFYAKGTTNNTERQLVYTLNISLTNSGFTSGLKLTKNTLTPWRTTLENQCADSLSKQVNTASAKK